jgi:hypothetical protein
MGSGKDAYQVQQCDTCFEHSHDYDWVITTNVGNIDIPRVDRQGTYEPPRWTRAQKGQPAATEHDYTNYVAAQKSSLFHQQVQEMSGLPDVPKYPRVFDYHYANRVLPVGAMVPDLPQWQADLADMLKELGPSKQANISVVIAKTSDQTFRRKVEAAWEGGNKNDIVVIVGVQDDLKILWADVVTFGGNIGNEALQVDLRNALLDVGIVERTKVLPLIAQHVRTQYTRPQMKDFAYLGYAMEPDTWYQVTFFILFVFMNIVLTVVFHRTNFFSPVARYRVR